MQQAAAYYRVTFTYSHFNGPGRGGGATIDTDLLVTFRRNREKKTSLGGFLSKANQARPFIPMKYFFVCVYVALVRLVDVKKSSASPLYL